MIADGWIDLLSFPAPPMDLGPAGILLLIALGLTCAVIVVIDARERIIPDGCNLLVAVLGLGMAGVETRAALGPALLHGLIVFALFWLFRAGYRRVRGHHGLGLGDVKFLGAAGTWIGLAGVPPTILTASLAALIWIGAARLRGEAVTASTAIPFGPFLVVGFLAVLALRLWAP